MRATVFNIERGSFVDGHGIRTTVFLKGCNLRCAWCHNPESQSPQTQILLYRDKCTGCGICSGKCPNKFSSCDLCGRCALYCPNGAREICGREYGVDELLTEIIKDRDFYESSGGGVTFSGGEPMLRTDFLREILKRCKENQISTAIDTAGHVPFERFEDVLPYTDLLLYDVKCMDSERHKRYTGFGNSLILDNLKRLLSTGKEIWVRVPIIPTVNDSVEEMLALRGFFEKHGRPSKVELLPYHAAGDRKYAALGQTEIPDFSVPTQDHLARLYKVLES